MSTGEPTDINIIKTEPTTIADVRIINSAGWTITASAVLNGGSTYLINTAGMTVYTINSGVIAAGGSLSIINTAGWVVASSASIMNSAGWVVAASCTIMNSSNIGIGYMDSNNTYRTFKEADGEVRVCAKDYYDAIAEGDIPDHKRWMKVGFTPNIATGNVESEVWSGAGSYVFPTVGMNMGIVSTSTADSSGGLGAHFVTLYYLDTAWAEQTEVVEMAGNATANTVAKDIYRINSFLVTSAGTFQKASGNIIVTATNGGTRYNYITATHTRARNAQYTVPAGKTLYVNKVNVGFGNVSNTPQFARFFTRANVNPQTGSASTLFYTFTEFISYNQSIINDFRLPTKLPEKTDIKVSVQATAAGSGMVTMRGWIES